MSVMSLTSLFKFAMQMLYEQTMSSLTTEAQGMTEHRRNCQVMSSANLHVVPAYVYVVKATLTCCCWRNQQILRADG